MVRPRNQAFGSTDSSKTLLLQQWSGFADLDQFGQLFLVIDEFVAQVYDVFGHPDRVASARATDSESSSLRARHFATSAIWVLLSALRASMPRSLLRTRAVSALTDWV